MAAEVRASAAAQQQIALPPEGTDITNIQDEDLLRRMWQATEDFGRKKEIRARMYKLREQRLKEFYTTGEVLSDLMSTTLDSSTSATESNANNSSTVVRRTTYAASESGDSVGGLMVTETIRGGGGSQESLIIRYRSGGNEDENLKNIEMDRRQLQGSSELIYESGGKTTRSTMSSQSSAIITKSSSYGLHSQSLADQGFLTMKSKEIRDSESPTRDFSHLHNRQITTTTQGGPGSGGYWYEESRSYHTGDGGAEVVHYGTRGGQHTSSSVIEYGDGGGSTYRTGESAVSERREQTSSSNKSSSHQEHSASSSYSFSSRSTQDWIQRHQDDESFVRDTSQPQQIENVRRGAYEESTVKERETTDGKTSVHVEQTSKTERVSDVAENESRIRKEETESRRTTTEKFEEVENKDEPRGPKQKVTQRSKTGELPLEVNITKQVTTEITTSSAPQDSVPTPDGGSWTVVSGKQNGVSSSTDEFVFRSGATTETSNTRETTQRIMTTDSADDSTIITETQKVVTDTSTSGKPSSYVPAAGKPTPVDSKVPSPCTEVKSIMKQTTTTTETTSTAQPSPQGSYYIQTKRISTEVSPTHEAFARSLRASPEKTQTYSTRVSSKSSIDTNTTILSSPTRTQRTSVASPTGRSSSPEKGTHRQRDRSSPLKQQTPSPSASKEKRKLSSSLSKGIGGKRTATPGHSPSVSPVRGRSPCSDDDEPRKRVAASPEKKSPREESPRKSPGKETKPSLRKTPEKSPARDTPDSPQELPKRKSSETTVTKERTTSTGRRPSKGPKDERSTVRRPSNDRLTSPAGSPMKDKGPEFPKEKKPGDDKSPTGIQRPKDLDLKTRPTTGTKVTPSSPYDKTPTTPKGQDKPKEDKRRPSKDSTEPQKVTPERESIKTHQPEEFEVVCEAPETFDVKIITPIVTSVEYPTDEPEKKSKKTPVEEEKLTKKVEHELEIERLKRPSLIPDDITTEDEETPSKAPDAAPVTSEIRPSEVEDEDTPRETKDVQEEPIVPITDTLVLRPTKKDEPKETPTKEDETPLREASPAKETIKSTRRSPIRDSPARDDEPKLGYRKSPSPCRDSPLRKTKRTPSPAESPARDSPHASSPVRDTQRKQSPSPARDVPSSASPKGRSPVRQIKKAPSPAKESPKSFSPSRQSPARSSPVRDSARKPSPSRTDDVPKKSTEKPCKRDSPMRETPRTHSPSSAKELPARDHPRRHSPSPAKEFPTQKSPARASPLREPTKEHSPSPTRDTQTKRPIGKSPEREVLRKSPERETSRKPSKEAESPIRRRPEEKPTHEKSPSRKPSLKESPMKYSPARKTPERDMPSKSPARQSPARDTGRTPEKERKETRTRSSPAKEAPKRDSSPKKPGDNELPKKPSITRKASDKAIPKKDTTARRSQSTEIPSTKPASPFKDSPKTDDMPLRKAPTAQSPINKPCTKESPVGKIPKYSSPTRQPADSSPGDSPNANKPWRQSPVKHTPKETTDSPAKTPVKEYPPSGIPRTMSPARRPGDSLPSSPDSPKQKEGRPQPSVSSPEKSLPSHRPSRSPERASPKKQPEKSKPVSKIPGRAPGSNITPPSQKRKAPTSSIPSYTSPQRRFPKEECCPHHVVDAPQPEPKGTIRRPKPGSKIPESNVRRPGESSTDRKSTKITVVTSRESKKPKKQRPFSETDSEEEVSSTETEENERECIEERITVTEKDIRSVSEYFVQDMTKDQYPLSSVGQVDRPVSLSLITTATKTVTSGGEMHQIIDSEGNVITTTYQQPSTMTMSISCKNTDLDGKEVTHTMRKTTYPDRPDEDEDVDIMEIDDDDDCKFTPAIEYPFDEETPKAPKQIPTKTSPKRFESPVKTIKRDTKPQTGPGRRPTTESPVRRPLNETEPAKRRIPANTTPSTPRQPAPGKTTPSATKKVTPVDEPQDEKTSPKSLRKPAQISRLPAKQSPKFEAKKITSVTEKSTVQKGKTTVTTMVTSATRQKSSAVSTVVEKLHTRQPLKDVRQPKQLKPAPKNKIPQKTGKGIPVKDPKKRVTNGHIPHPTEQDDDTEEEIDEKDISVASDVEKTEKYYDEEEVIDEEKVNDTVQVHEVTTKRVDEKTHGLHPSTAFTTVTGIQTTTEIRQVSRESTPDAPGRRPRYADRVSEPDDDDMYYEEKGVTKVARRDQEQIDRTLNITMPRLETVEQTYEEEEELREFERTEIEQRRQVRMEQVTDLDEDEAKPNEDDDIEPANLSVASKVSRFLTASATAAAPPQPSQAPKMEPRGPRRPSWEPEEPARYPKGDEVDQKTHKTEELSSFAVKRARDIFETIAKTPSNSELTPTTPKLKTDVLGKASIFETKQFEETNRVRTTQNLRKSFTGSEESLGEEGLPKEKPCTVYTESEDDYEDENVEQIKESPSKKPLPKETTPYKPQFTKESSPHRTYRAPKEDMPKEPSPSRVVKPEYERDAPKEPLRKYSSPSTEKPEAPREKRPSIRDDTYDEPCDDRLPEEQKPKKQEPFTPKATDTDSRPRKNIFRDENIPKEDEQVPKVKKTSIGSGMGREAFLKRISKFTSTEESKTVKESPKLKPVSKFQPKPEVDEPSRRPSKDIESEPKRVPTESPTRRPSRDDTKYRKSPAREVSKPSTDSGSRRPSRDQPRSDVDSPRRTPTRETSSQSNEYTRRTDTYTRKTSKEIYRSELESPRRTPTRETPTQVTETTRRLSTDTFTRRPKDRQPGDAESPRRTPTRETPSQPKKPQEDSRPSYESPRRMSRDYPKEDTTPKDDRPKGATFTRRPSKDRVRDDDTPKDATFTRKPKITKEYSPGPEDHYPKGSDTFTRRPSHDRQSPRRDSPRREVDEVSQFNTYTRKTSTERFKESSVSPRSSPARDTQPKRPEDRRPSQDRVVDDKRRGSDTFTRRRSQPRDEQPKKPETDGDAFKPYSRTKTQELLDDGNKLKPDDKTPKKLSSSRFETFTKRDSSTTVTKDETKRLMPTSADRTPKKLSGSRFETFTKKDSATSIKTDVSRAKTTSITRNSVEREVEFKQDRVECEETTRYVPEKPTTRTDRKTPERVPERAPEKIERRPLERIDRTPERKTPERKSPERKDDSHIGEPMRRKPSRDEEEKPVRKAPEEEEPRFHTKRRPSKEGSPESRPDDAIPVDQQRRRSSGAKFGAVLRQSSSVGSRVEALLSKVEKRSSTTTTVASTKRRPSKGADSSLEIEEIYDLEFLEQMLEKATDYDQRRRIRAQIRIVRRGCPEGTKEAPKEVPKDTHREQPKESPREQPKEAPKETPKDIPLRKTQPEDELPSQEKTLTRKPSRAEEVGGELTSPSVVAKLLPSSTTSTTRQTPKKNSLTSGLPREACPTDSITSSYGVGPTDESGRPLFGLRALRRAQPSAPASSPNTQSRETSLERQSPDRSDVRDSSGRPLFGLRAITISSNKEVRRVIEKSPDREEERPESEDEEDSVQRRDMPSTASTAETSVHLRDLVRRHEQHARGNVPSQPVTTSQKPRARLRDSFILPQDDEPEDERGQPKSADVSPASKTFPSALPSSVAESGKIVAERSSTLKSIIQKHEKNTDSEYSSDKLNRRDSGLGAYTEEEELVQAKNNYCQRAQDYTTDEDEEDDYDDEEYQEKNNGQSQETTRVKVTSDVVRRPGILKKPKDEVTDSTTATSTSVTVRQSEKSGSISLKKDVIQSVEEDEVGRTSSDEASSSRGEVEICSTSTPYRVDDDDVRHSGYSSTTTTVTRRVVSGSESPKVVTTTTTVRRSTGRPDEEKDSSKKKFESPSTAFPRITRGGSVKALSQKFQQAAAEAEKNSSSYPKAGLIFRTASFRQTSSPPTTLNTPVHSPSAPCIPSTANVNGHAGTTVEEVVERRSSTRGSQKDDSDYSQQIRRRSVERASPSSSRRSSEVTTVSRQPIVDEFDEVHGESLSSEQRNGQSRSFLGNQTKVTGVQDVLSRMREADNEGPAEGDTVEDSEARALLNKFLGAQVILQGMEPLIHAQSPTLVRQVEKQRVQKETTTVVYSPDIDLDGIWDERRLRQLLESCSDYDGRRKIRARILTVMAEQKVTAEIVAEGRLEAEESARSKAILPKQSDDRQMESSTTVLRSVQGELLPLIVDQLKTSLERGEGSGGGPLSGFRISSSSSEEGPFDSGTESGDDRRNLRKKRMQQLQQKTSAGEEGDAEDEEEEDEEHQIPQVEFSSFMEGLKTSIEEAAARRRKERAPVDGEDSELTQREDRIEKQLVNNDKKGVAGVGGELLNEIHTALDKLHGTLQTSSGLDPEKSQALISLISRLQSSLEEEQKSRKENPPEVIPPPAAPPPRTVVPDWKARCQKKRQGRAHTVGVSQEELEDARRLLQSKEKEEVAIKMGEKEEATSTFANNECKSYSLMKQSSAGDLAPPPWATNSVAARVFRPVRFEPRFSPSWASMFNKTAKPFQREALGKNPPQASKYPPPLPLPPAQPQLSTPSVASSSENFGKTPEPFIGATIAESTQKPLENFPKPSSDTPSSSVPYLPESHFMSSPAIAPHSPTTWQSPISPNPPTLSSSRTSTGTSSISHQDSESSISVSTKPEDEDECPSNEAQENGESDEEDDDGIDSEEVTQVTEREVIPIKNGVRNTEPLLSTASQIRPSEKRSVHHSLSLDSGTKRAHEDTLTTPSDAGKCPSPLARSWTLDDPSALLFTQAESVQIAVHKAAIKKQLTQEEEQRMRLPLRPEKDNGYSARQPEDDATPVVYAPVVAREAGGVDSYGERGSEGRTNGDAHVLRTKSGSSVASVSSSGDSSTVPNGIYRVNDAEENPPVPIRRESIPATNNSYDNAWKGTKEHKNVNGDREWNQTNGQEISGSEGYGRKGSATFKEITNGDSMERYKELADDELSRLNSQVTNQSRQQSRVEKKKKMKRANTIDIPKPLNFYVDEDDYSSGEELEGEGDAKESSGANNHRAAYLALRGPIRVKIPQSKPLAPSFQAKTENDRKFLAFLEQHSGQAPNRTDVQSSYHSSARGGAHWSNRFSNIKTAFEGSGGRGSEHNLGRGRGMGRNSLGEIGGPASARNFWRAADDSVTRSRGSSHGPRLSREGSSLLRRLFEERDAASAENSGISGKADPRPAENAGKLPWTAETKAEDSAVVIGSLTVASKKQLFSASPREVKGPVPVGKFSHAPLSAFRPIHSKDQTIVPTQGPIPLSSPGAVRLASQKFGAHPSATPAKPQVNNVPQSTKSSHNNKVTFVPAQGSHSPVGGPPPWAKSDAHDRVHSTSARFETLSHNPSPPPPMSFTSHSVAHSQLYDPVQTLGGMPEPPKSTIHPNYMDHSQGSMLIQRSIDPQTSVPTPPPRSNVHHPPVSHPPPKSHSPPPPPVPHPPNYMESSSPVVKDQLPSHPKTIYRQPSPPLHSPKVVFREATPPPAIPSLPRSNDEPPSPEPELQCAAVSKVMGGPVSQQAVLQKRRRGGEDGEEEEEGRESAARNLSSALHRLSVSPSRPPRVTPTGPPKNMDNLSKEEPLDSGRVFSAETFLHPSHASLISETQGVHKRESTSYSPLPPMEVGSPQNTESKEERQVPEKLSLKEQEEFYQKQLRAVREAQEARRRYEEAKKESFKRTSKSYTHENTVPPPPPPSNRPQRASLTTDTKVENNESVVTMRLQIPVNEHYNSYVSEHSSSPVQKGIGPIRSNSQHDVRHTMASVSPVQQVVEIPRRDTEDRSPTSVLQKSESWHMLGQLGQASLGSKRPQSIALDQSKRRAPPSLPKMSFPKQFEARLSPETVESKQKKVEAYLRASAGSKSVSGTSSPSKQKMSVSEPMTPLLLDDNLENVDEAFESLFNAATKAKGKRTTSEKGQEFSKDQWSSHMGLQKSQSHHLLRPPAPARESSASPQFQRKQKAWEESCMVKTKLAQNISGSHSEATSMSSSTDSSVTKTEVHTKTSNYSATVTGKSRVSKDVIDLVSSYFSPPPKTMSPFAKFKQLDEQNAGSLPNSPKSPGGTGPLFKFTDPQLSRSASGVKDKLLYWCQVKTKEYKNIQIENFSTSWSNGLAFCALIHHFCPDAFDYDTLRPEERRKNFDLAFRVADEKAGIAPLLDVEDMVTMRKPDWKCVFTYVQSIYRRFKDED